MELRLKSKRYTKLSNFQKQLLATILSFDETKSLSPDEHQALAKAMGFQNISPTKLANTMCVLFDVKASTNNSYHKALVEILDSLFEDTIDEDSLECAYRSIISSSHATSK